MSDGFPRELLGQSIEERLAYFKQYIVFHPKLREAHDALLRAVQEPCGASLICVYGPTGIGKTTLRLRVQQKLIEAALHTLEEDRERMPVVGIELKTSGTRNFNWKEYYTSALIALEKPPTQGRVTAPEMRGALEHALRHRRPDIFFIDDAQNFAEITSGHKRQDQLDHIKSLVDATGILHGSIGTYELKEFQNLSPQISRRSLDIHFKRYHQDSKQDLLEFAKVIKSLQCQMPLEETPNLVEHAEYIYIGTLGCIGLLKNWLIRAFEEALNENAKTVTIEHLEKHSLPASMLEVMLKDINQGEKLFAETDSDRNRLRSDDNLETYEEF